jgi:hypothetical protein
LEKQTLVAPMVVFLVANVFQNHGKHEEMMLERFFFPQFIKKYIFSQNIEEHLEKKATIWTFVTN